jgi:cbb3-type cytochrome oxidase subunit 1
MEDRKMPLLARWYIKTGLAHFAVALLIGLVLAVQPLLHLSSSLAVLRPVFLHLLIVGWITQLIIGVAYWMFPKQSREHPRGSIKVGWLVFALLNLGLILRGIGEPLFALNPDPSTGLLLAMSAVMQVVAGWLFIANTWTRVKER